MKPEKGLQPINEVKSDVVQVALKLPPNLGIEDGIALDVSQLERLCRIAGIESLNITSHSDRSSGEGVVLGIDPNGAAIGGFESGATNQSEITHGKGKLYRVSIWDKAAISLDLEAIEQKVAEGPNELNAIDKWAKILNDELRGEMRKVGLKALWQIDERLPKTQRYLWMVAWIYMGMSVLTEQEPQPSTALCLWGLLGYIGFENLIKALFNEKISSIQNTKINTRFSVMNTFGVEIDRAIIFAVCMQLRPLIKKTVPQAKLG